MQQYRMTTNRRDGVKFDSYVSAKSDTAAFALRAEHAKRIGGNFTVSIARVTLDAQFAANAAR